MASTERADGLSPKLGSERVRRREFLALGASLGAGGLLLGACGGDKSAAGRKVDTALLRLHLDEDMENLDPGFQPGHSDSNVAVNIFENLLTFKPGTFQPVNQLAETWRPSADGLRYDFTLKRNIPFHKGYGELTAEDVKFSFERIAGLTKPKVESPYAGDWAALKEVQLRGRYQGTIVLKEPYAPLMQTTIPAQAGQIVSKKAVQELGKKFATQPVGTGPYEFVSWRPNQSVMLKRFERYGGASSGFARPPVWQQIKFLVIGEDNPTAIALETGALDFAVLPTNAVDRFKGNSEFATTSRTTLNYNWIGMNVRHESFRDRDVRLAVRYGVDVPAIIQAAFDGRYRQATALLPPTMPIGYWKEAPTYQRDVARARALLVRAGAQGRKVQMSVSKDEPGAPTVAEVVQANLREVGLDVEVLVQESAVFEQATERANAGKQLFYTGFTTQPDPHWSTLWFACDQVGTWNWMSWCNRKYSRLESEATRVLEPARRQQMYVDMQRLMDQDVPAVWVAWPTDFFAHKTSIRPSLRPDGRFQAWDFRPAPNAT
jgi:peptide/nickel transport system substrate-binding protein